MKETTSALKYSVDCSIRAVSVGLLTWYSDIWPEWSWPPSSCPTRCWISSSRWGEVWGVSWVTCSDLLLESRRAAGDAGGPLGLLDPEQGQDGAGGHRHLPRSTRPHHLLRPQVRPDPGLRSEHPPAVWAGGPPEGGAGHDGVGRVAGVRWEGPADDHLVSEEQGQSALSSQELHLRCSDQTVLCLHSRPHTQPQDGRRGRGGEALPRVWDRWDHRPPPPGRGPPGEGCQSDRPQRAGDQPGGWPGAPGVRQSGHHRQALEPRQGNSRAGAPWPSVSSKSAEWQLATDRLVQLTCAKLRSPLCVTGSRGSERTVRIWSVEVLPENISKIKLKSRTEIVWEFSDWRTMWGRLTSTQSGRWGWWRWCWEMLVQVGHWRWWRILSLLVHGEVSGRPVRGGLSLLQVPQHLRGGQHLRPHPGRRVSPTELQREGWSGHYSRLLEGGSEGSGPHWLLVVLFIFHILPVKNCVLLHVTSEVRSLQSLSVSNDQFPRDLSGECIFRDIYTNGIYLDVCSLYIKSRVSAWCPQNHLIFTLFLLRVILL